MIFQNFPNVVIFFNLQLIGSLDTKQQIYPAWENIFQDIKNNSLKHYLRFPIGIWPEGIMSNYTYLQVIWVSIKSICFTISFEMWHFNTCSEYRLSRQMIGRDTFIDENDYCKIMNILIYPTSDILFGVTANSQMYNEKY